MKTHTEIETRIATLTAAIELLQEQVGALEVERRKLGVCVTDRLSARLRNALQMELNRSEIYKSDFEARSERELLKIPGIGKTCLGEVRALFESFEIPVGEWK